MAAAIQTMPQCCSSRVPGKLESLHVCQRTSFRQCRTLFISRRAMRRGFTKPLARVLGLYTKARRLAFANVRLWHIADVRLALMNVRFEGNNGHDADATRCLLLTHSGLQWVRGASVARDGLAGWAACEHHFGCP